MPAVIPFSESFVPRRISRQSWVFTSPPPRCFLWGHLTQLVRIWLGPTVYQNSTAPLGPIYRLCKLVRVSDAWSRSNMQDYASGSLYFLPSIFDSTTSVGLHQGMLYDVLDSNVPSGNATVAATGFNISCGSLPDTPPLAGPDLQSWISGADRRIIIYSTRKLRWLDGNPSDNRDIEPGIIAQISSLDPQSRSIILYSTIPILDCHGNNGSWVDVTSSMNTSVSSIQIFQCSLSLLRQTAGVDAQSRQLCQT